MTKPLLLIALLALLPACNASSPLEKRYIAVRPNYGDRPLPNAGDTAPSPLQIVNEDPTRRGTPEIQTRITGTWTFTAPKTTTTVERKNAAASQFTIYNGRPAPDATPLIVIDVSPADPTGWVPDPKNYTVTSKRDFLLHGNPATEWTGTTLAGKDFTALTISRPNASEGDHCYALATPSNADERKLTHDILASITWTAKP